MKLVILAAILGLSAAAPQGYYQHQQPYQHQYQVRARSDLDRNARILRSDSDVNEAGFRYGFETENGIQAQESGVESDGIQAQGSYSYTGDDGQLYSVQYTADANGFQAQGAHIPTAPPVPEEIRQALIRNAQDEANGIFDDGSYHEGKYSAGPGVVVARTTYQPFRQPAFNPRPFKPRPYNF